MRGFRSLYPHTTIGRAEPGRKPLEVTIAHENPSLRRALFASSKSAAKTDRLKKPDLWAKVTSRGIRISSALPPASWVPHFACSGKRIGQRPSARSGRLERLDLPAPAQLGLWTIPAKATCGWFWWHLLPPKGANLRDRFYERWKARKVRQQITAPARLRGGFCGRRYIRKDRKQFCAPARFLGSALCL